MAIKHLSLCAKLYDKNKQCYVCGKETQIANYTIWRSINSDLSIVLYCITCANKYLYWQKDNIDIVFNTTDKEKYLNYMMLL